MFRRTNISGVYAGMYCKSAVEYSTQCQFYRRVGPENLLPPPIPLAEEWDVQLLHDWYVTY